MKKIFASAIVGLVAWLGAPSQSDAASFLLGGDGSVPIPPGEVGVLLNNVGPSGFTDTFSFTLVGGSGSIDVQITDTEVFTLNIFGLTLTLWQGDPTDINPDTLLATGSVIGTNPDVLSLAFSALAPSVQYFLQVTGATEGAGLYTGGYSVSEIPPIPVPGAVWLMGTALVGFAAVSRRRRNNA